MVYSDSVVEIRPTKPADRLLRFFRVGRFWISQICDVSVPDFPLALTWDQVPRSLVIAAYREAKRNNQQIEGAI